MSSSFSISVQDARQFLSDLAERPANLRPAVLFSDPPYELTKGGLANANGVGDHILMGGKLSNKIYDNSGAICGINLNWEDWASLAFEALAPQAEAIIMCNDKHVGRAQRAFEAAGFSFHNFLYWRKSAHGVSVVNRWMRKDTEFALYLYKGPARPVQKGYRHLGQGLSTPHFRPECKITDPHTGRTTFHPNEKPVKLGLDWLGAIARPGETVIDPFAGTAAFGVAAQALGLDFLGCEIDPIIADIATVRLSRAAHLGPSYLRQKYGGTLPLDFRGSEREGDYA